MYREYGQVVAVTNRSLTERPFLEQIRRVCEMHPDALILREKDLSEKEYEELAKEVMAICAEYKVPCILHTFWRVAEKLKCHHKQPQQISHLKCWHNDHRIKEKSGIIVDVCPEI